MIGALLMAAGPFPDGVRGQLPGRAALPAARRRLLQGQHRRPGRRPLRARRQAPRRRLPDLPARGADRGDRRALVCGTLGEKVGWHWGFGAAGVGMVIGLVIYLAGRRWLPAETALPAPGKAGAAAAGTGRRRPDRRARGLILPLLVLSAVGNQQIFDAYLLWGEATLGSRLLRPEHAGDLAGLAGRDRQRRRRSCCRSCSGAGGRSAGASRNEITKLAIGVADLRAGAAGAGHRLAGRQRRRARRSGSSGRCAFHIVNDIGFANVFPVGLALYSRASPQGRRGHDDRHLLPSPVRLQPAGRLARRLPRKHGGEPILADARGLVAAGGVGLLVVRSFAGRILAPAPPDEPQGSAAARLTSRQPGRNRPIPSAQSRNDGG